MCKRVVFFQCRNEFITCMCKVVTCVFTMVTCKIANFTWSHGNSTNTPHIWQLTFRYVLFLQKHTDISTPLHQLSSSTRLSKYLHPFFVLHIGSALAISPYKMCLSPIKWGISPKIINTRDSCYIRATPKCSHFLYSRYNPSQKGETAC